MSVTTRGRIFQVSTSQGGVPKRAVASAVLGELGLEGDRVAHPKSHGGPERALCLYSLERILALQEEGHPIFPGSAGENLTITGLDWEQLKPGSRLQLGEQALVEVTRYTVPCSEITASFADRDSTRIHQDKHPGWSRVYVRVLQVGVLKPGDQVILIA